MHGLFLTQENYWWIGCLFLVQFRKQSVKECIMPGTVLGTVGDIPKMKKMQPPAKWASDLIKAISWLPKGMCSRWYKADGIQTVHRNDKEIEKQLNHAGGDFGLHLKGTVVISKGKVEMVREGILSEKNRYGCKIRKHENGQSTEDFKGRKIILWILSW